MQKSSCHSCDCKSTSAAASTQKRSKHRLPRTVVPHRYQVTLAPDLTGDVAKLSARGRVQIELDVLRSRRTITLNSAGLSFDTAEIHNADGVKQSGTVRFDQKLETATISFPAEIGKGRWVLTIDSYTARISHDKDAGLFVTNWWVDKTAAETPTATTQHNAPDTQNHEQPGAPDQEAQAEQAPPEVAKIEHRMMGSQFESADARCAFPCFDQPDMKATFKVFMVVDRDFTALSNGDVVSVTDHDGQWGQGKKIVEFAETMIMSTYLVAFVAGKLEHSDPVDVNGVRMQMWTIPGKIGTTTAAMAAACFGLKYFEDYFGIRYPGGKKLDMVSVPNFGWGGMENVGLIVYQSGCVELNDGQESLESQFGSFLIVMHELAHQWFGDLVTMLWWDDLWLNESFATFMSYKAMAAWQPTWGTWDRFARGRERSFQMDVLRTSHPIQQPVENPRETLTLVDAITYEKGCAVLYHIEQHIGPEVFRQGISAYLTKHAFGNTVAKDLWNSLESACHSQCSGLPIASVMETWIETMGFPLLSVSGSPQSGRIEIQQQRLRLIPCADDKGIIWPVPVTIEVADANGCRRTEKLLLTGRSQTVVLGRHFRWVKLNAGGTGFYRVHYSDNLQQLLTGDGKNLSVIERHNLLSDATAALQTRHAHIEGHLNLLLSFLGETNPEVWPAVRQGLESIGTYTPPELKHQLRLVIAGALKKLAPEMGWEPEGDVLPFAKGWMPYDLNLNPLIQQASAVVLDAWRKDPHALELEMMAYGAMVLHFAGVEAPEEFKALQKAGVRKQPFGPDVQRYLVTISRLAATDSPHADVFYLIASLLLGERAKRPDKVDVFIKEWPDLIKNPGQPFNVTHRVRELDNHDDPAVARVLAKLFAEHQYAPAAKAIAQAMEHIRSNVLARRAHSKRLAAWLTNAAGRAA